MKGTEGGKALVKILGVLVGVTFMAAGVQDNYHVRSLKSGGRTAVVEPIASYTEHRKRGMRTYHAEFTFAIEGGRKVTKHAEFPEGHIEDFKAGRPVKVYYDASDPSEFVFEKDHGSWFLVYAGAAIAVVALLLG